MKDTKEKTNDICGFRINSSEDVNNENWSKVINHFLFLITRKEIYSEIAAN